MAANERDAPVRELAALCLHYVSVWFAVVPFCMLYSIVMNNTHGPFISFLCVFCEKSSRKAQYVPVLPGLVMPRGYLSSAIGVLDSRWGVLSTPIETGTLLSSYHYSLGLIGLSSKVIFS